MIVLRPRRAQNARSSRSFQSLLDAVRNPRATRADTASETVDEVLIFIGNLAFAVAFPGFLVSM